MVGRIGFHGKRGDGRHADVCVVEAVGDAASLFNPDEPEDIKLKIEDVLYSTELTNQLKNKGIKRSDFFSWEKCAKETLDVYKKVLN